MVTKLMYAAVAATLLSPMPALAGDLGSYGDYGAGAYEANEDYAPYEDYAPVVRKKIIVGRPVVIEKRVVVERPVILEERVVVERPVILEKRGYVVERPLKYGHGPRYAKRYHRKHFHKNRERHGYGRHSDYRGYDQY